MNMLPSNEIKIKILHQNQVNNYYFPRTVFSNQCENLTFLFDDISLTIKCNAEEFRNSSFLLNGKLEAYNIKWYTQP